MRAVLENECVPLTAPERNVLLTRGYIAVSDFRIKHVIWYEVMDSVLVLNKRSCRQYQ